MLSRLGPASLRGAVLLNAKSPLLGAAIRPAIRLQAVMPPRWAGVRMKSTIGTEIQAIGTQSANATTDTASQAIEAASDTVSQVATVLPDQLGYFQSIGLANSWVWPSGFFQHVFELTHYYTGLPWWGTILAVTVALRFMMLPLYVSASDSTARMARIKPELNELMEQTKVATEQIDIQRAMLARRQLMKTHNVKVTNMLKPIAAVPIFLGVFGALSGMSTAPVAAMATEGIFWFQDLTAADPYCGLQIITACLYAITFKVFGGETGSANLSPVMKKLFTWMPFVAVPLTMSLPASVCFYFAINAVFSIVQSNALKMAPFRKALNLAPLLTPEEQKAIDAKLAASQSDSIMGALRQRYDDAKQKAEKKMEQEQKEQRAAASRVAADNNKYVQIKPRK